MHDTSLDSEEERKKLNKIAIGLFLFVIFVWSAFWFLIISFIGKPDGAGTFGDMFGSVNALFSGWAFAGVIYAILLQRRELELQRTELKTTNKMLEAQKHEFSVQNETLKKQRFENTFFQMLSLHHEIVNSMHYFRVKDLSAYSMSFVKEEKIKIEASGRNCFEHYLELFFASWLEATRGRADDSEIKKIKDSYKIFYNSAQVYVGHYFRNLYNIVKFINNSDMTFEEKKVYSNLVRAQLSSYELLLLFYNCLSSRGNKKFKPLIEEYSFLNNLPTGRLITRDHKKLYDPNAYGTRAKKLFADDDQKP